MGTSMPTRPKEVFVKSIPSVVRFMKFAPLGFVFCFTLCQRGAGVKWGEFISFVKYGGIMKLVNLFVVIFLAFLSITAAAWDGAIEGQIQSIDVAPGENFGFRISLKNSPKLCGNGHAWAYVNESDSNYKTFVSVLLAAKMAEKTVTIYTGRETATGNGYCHIGYVSMQ